MATLTNSDFKTYLQLLRRDSAAWAEMQALSPDRNDWKATMQAIEDWFTPSKQLEIKNAMEAGASLSLSNALAKKLFAVWMANKWGGE